MGDRRAASRGRSRKSLCASWSCSCSSVGRCFCSSYSSSSAAAAAAAAARAQGLHGSGGRGPCSYRRLIHNFEEVLRRRLRGRLRASWLSPSIRSGIVVTAPKKALLGSETQLLSVLPLPLRPFPLH